MARYALADDQLVAESRLHGEQLHPEWVALVTRAVAVAAASGK